jgi:hypothetical protein
MRGLTLYVPMLSMHEMKLVLLGVCAEWHYTYAMYTRNEPWLTLSMRERHLPYIKYARNYTILMPSMRGMTLALL